MAHNSTSGVIFHTLTLCEAGVNNRELVDVKPRDSQWSQQDTMCKDSQPAFRNMWLGRWPTCIRCIRNGHHTYEQAVLLIPPLYDPREHSNPCASDAHIRNAAPHNFGAELRLPPLSTCSSSTFSSFSNSAVRTVDISFLRSL